VQGSDDGLGGFGNISVSKKSSRRNELDEYLALGVENVKDPLMWWFDNRKAYPNLSRMALDYLSIPGMFFLAPPQTLYTNCFPATSTAVERVFSQGRHLLHFTRNRLSPSSIRAYLCLGSWGRHGMLRTEDVLAAVRSRKRKRAHSVSEDEK
jgi:hypothetical protein